MDAYGLTMYRSNVTRVEYIYNISSARLFPNSKVIPFPDNTIYICEYWPISCNATVLAPHPTASTAPSDPSIMAVYIHHFQIEESYGTDTKIICTGTRAKVREC